MSVVEVRRPPLSSDWSASPPSAEASPPRRRFALLSRPPVKSAPLPPPPLDPASDRRRPGGGAGSSISKSKAADGLAGSAGGFEAGFGGESLLAVAVTPEQATNTSAYDESAVWFHVRLQDHCEDNGV